MTVVQPEVTYAREAIFNVTQENGMDKILRVRRKIARTCTNKNNIKRRDSGG